MYKGWNDAMVRSHELFTAWMLLLNEERRTAGYWHLYEHDKVYRTEEKRKFYFDDVWNREQRPSPSERRHHQHLLRSSLYLLLSSYPQ